jgi:hypothetical protein
LDKILSDGAMRAREVASMTIMDVYDRVGFLPNVAGHGEARG